MAAAAAQRYVDSDSARPSEDLVTLARQKLIVALDVDSVEIAQALVDTLGNEVTFYKVGLGLQLGGGDEFARRLKAQFKRVFLDYKYYDISETVKSAVSHAAKIGIDFLTVHGTAEIMSSAVEGRGDSDTKILCVTVLTSMDADDLEEMGVRADVTVEELVVNRALRAMKAGIDGVIASAHEVEAIKQRSDGKLMVVAPGIRREGSPRHDQKRVATPAQAVKAGADYLVIGRDITASKDPRQAAHDIIIEMAVALRT
jgi:orotidine-5'-phosphate decarboxylase